jgi:hypothetical protein
MRRATFVIAATLWVAGLSLAGRADAWTHSTTTPWQVPGGVGANTVVASDGAGGTFVAWSQLGSGYDVNLQHLDASGKELWTHGGVVVCAASGTQAPYFLVPDLSGGVIVVWIDYRVNSNGDLYARKVNAAGTPLWATDGVAVATNAEYKESISAAPDRQGGVVVCWADYRNVATTSEDIFLQHLTSAGSPTLPANGLAVCNAAAQQQAPVVACDAYGYANVAWTDFRSGTADIYAQHVLLSTGAVQWAANGVGVCAQPWGAYSPRIVMSSAEDPVVAWIDQRTGVTQVYAQALQGFSGAGYWAANGVLVSSPPNPSGLLSCLVTDGVGGFVAVFGSWTTTAYVQLYAQRFELNGVTTWPAPGVLVRQATGNAFAADACADGFGGILVSWLDTRSDASDVYVQRIAPQGYTRWRGNGLPVANGTGAQYSGHVAVGPDGGAYLAVDDVPTSRVCLQKVDEWGYLAAEPIMNDVADVPNDNGGQVKVSWYASPLDVDPLYRNVTSYSVFRSVPPQLAARLEPLAASAPGGRLSLAGRNYLHTRMGAQDYFWEEIDQVTARHLASYSAVEPTNGDSMAAGNRPTAFLVQAIADYGASWWFSQADSGYSVDNVPPVTPAPFLGTYVSGRTSLSWGANAEPDLAGYRLYRGPSAGFATGPATLLAEVVDTAYVDVNGGPAWYKLSAVDIHGNESPVATLLPSGTLGVGPREPAAFFLAPPAPCPVARGRDAVLAFSLAHAGRAELLVIDASGRHVRTLAHGEFDAGPHRLSWDGLDDAGRRAAAGLYFVRLAQGTQVVTRRLVRTE